MTTQHSAYNFGIGDKKFKYGLTLAIPFGTSIAIFVTFYFMTCWLFNCNSSPFKEISLIYGSIGGIILGIFVRISTNKAYQRGLKMYAALDRQNDKCAICSRLITVDDAFYFDKEKVYCTNHNPFEQPTSEAVK